MRDSTWAASSRAAACRRHGLGLRAARVGDRGPFDHRRAAPADPRRRDVPRRVTIKRPIPCAPRRLAGRPPGRRSRAGRLQGVSRPSPRTALRSSDPPVGALSGTLGAAQTAAGCSRRGGPRPRPYARLEDVSVAQGSSCGSRSARRARRSKVRERRAPGPSARARVFAHPTLDYLIRGGARRYLPGLLARRSACQPAPDAGPGRKGG